MPSTRVHELALSLRAAYLTLHRQTETGLARFGVTADQFVVLASLARDDALTQRDLVARTTSDPSTLRAMLVLLERRGLVERRRHPTDGRARSVRLTTRGRRTFNQAWSASEPLRQRFAAALSRDEVAQLTTSLNEIAILMSRSRRPELVD